MSPKRYVPDRGHAVWISLDPKVGHEQAGRRPALVLSPLEYNRRVGLALCCPITGKSKGYPFEVPIPAGHVVSGVILADLIKSLDWRQRKVGYICDLPQKTVDETVDKLTTLLTG